MNASDSLNRLAKWRMILTGWQLGTRSKEDPEAQAVRDHREATLMLRAEVNAISRMLLQKDGYVAVPQEDFQRIVAEEADILSKAYEDKFPGAKATDEGIVLDVRAAEWMEKFPK